MVVSIILMALGLVAMSFFIYGKVTHYSTKTIMLKIIASLLFVSLAVYLFFYKEFPNVGIYIIIGAALGLLGDVALGLKRVIKSKDKLLTLLGFVFFALGHIVYVVGLFVNYYVDGHFLVILIPILCALLFGASVFLFEKMLKLSLGKFRFIAMTYLIVLGLLSASGLSLCILYEFKNTFLIVFFVGGVLFAISDGILSRTYFGKNPQTIELILSSVFYYLAQFIICFALFFL